MEQWRGRGCGLPLRSRDVRDGFVWRRTRRWRPACRMDSCHRAGAARRVRADDCDRRRNLRTSQEEGSRGTGARADPAAASSRRSCHNCEQYLAEHGARGKFSINGASSWSCAHGVERWRSECGCRLEAGTRQDWRLPLREAMEFVNNHGAAVYDRFAPGLVKDHQGALRRAIRLLIDPNPAVHEEFFIKFGVAGEVSRERLLRLFDMARCGQASLTSCAWFFDDFGGPEGRVALRWAARAVELA